MIVDVYKLPKKALRKIHFIEKILLNSEDRLYGIIKIDYRQGLIRFESLYFDNLFINLYTTSFTMTLEIREKNDRNRQYVHRFLSFNDVIKLFNNPKKHKLKIK